MNKILLGGVALTALFVGLFALYTLFNPPETTDQETLAPTPSDSTQIQSQSQSPSVPESGAGTMDELLATAADIECSFQYDDAESGQTVNGTFFKSGDELRIDSLMEDDEFGQYVSSLIYTTDTVYLWSDIGGQTYGVKTGRVETEASAEELNAPVDLDSEVDYECQAWEAVDRSVFIPPGEILFQDFGAMMQSGMEYGTIYEEGSAPLPVTPPVAQ